MSPVFPIDIDISKDTMGQTILKGLIEVSSTRLSQTASNG